MSESGFASLGPTLLARKGGAKPAMRPQIAPLVVDEAEVAALPEDKLEDLGWNDMGDESGVPISAAVVGPEAAAPHNPIVRRQQRRLEERVLADAVMTGPEDETEEAFDEGFEGAFDDAGEDDSFDYAAFEAEAEAEYHEDEADGAEGYVPEAPLPVAAPPVAPVAAPIPAPRAPRVASKAAERRAAFTLRLDPERHLKLRLAATMQGVSAQALLTEALDAMLAEFDDLDVIAAHLKRH
jgi:hypothetical protein